MFEMMIKRATDFQGDLAQYKLFQLYGCICLYNFLVLLDSIRSASHDNCHVVYVGKSEPGRGVNIVLFCINFESPTEESTM